MTAVRVLKVRSFLAKTERIAPDLRWNPEISFCFPFKRSGFSSSRLFPRIRKASLPMTKTADPVEPVSIEESLGTGTPSGLSSCSGLILRPLMRTSPVICLIPVDRLQLFRRNAMVPMTPANEIKVSSSRLLNWFHFSIRITTSLSIFLNYLSTPNLSSQL